MMKAMILTASAAVFMSMAAQAQPPHAKAHGKHKQHYQQHSGYAKGQTKVKYYYYPGCNVYYHPAQRRYAYYGSGGWIWVRTLPPTIVIGRSPVHEVYYPGMEVWADNVVHIRQYRRPSVNVQVDL